MNDSVNSMPINADIENESKDVHSQSMRIKCSIDEAYTVLSA